MIKDKNESEHAVGHLETTRVIWKTTYAPFRPELVLEMALGPAVSQ